eukprot:71849-Hanusia_phi.AAC.1
MVFSCTVSASQKADARCVHTVSGGPQPGTRSREVGGQKKASVQSARWSRPRRQRLRLFDRVQSSLLKADLP